MITDTHLHLIDRSALAYPWLSGVPPLDRDFSYAQYAAEAVPLGIDTVLHMEVDVADDDIERETARVKGLSREPGSMLRGAISACRPENDDFAQFLDRATAEPFVKGFRRVLHVMPDELSEGAVFRDNIRRLGPAGLPFDLVVLPRQIAKAAVLADLAPDAQFVLDHCGVPNIKGDAFAPWRAAVTYIARRPNVAAKISGIVAYADGDTWTVETLRPYVEHVVASFGFDRLVWGSDWPVCTLGGGLTRWVEATQVLFSGAGADEKAKLFSANARRIYKI